MLRTLVCVGLLWGATAAAEDAPVALSGTIDSVTVYRGQALVTRLIEIPAGEGLREIIVTDLPGQIERESIHAESADGFDVRSVRYRERTVNQDVRQEVRDLDEQIRKLQEELRVAERTLVELAWRKDYLGKLENFSASTANAELSKGVLDADTLMKLSEYLVTSRTALAEDELVGDKAKRDLIEKITLAESRRAELTRGSNRVAREAIVLIEQRASAGGVLRLRYLVNQANWEPSYNVRADGQRVVVEYNAAIEQMTGENWSNVSMTLSTATPVLASRAPRLAPFKVALRPIGASNGPQQQELLTQGGSYRARRSELFQQMRQMDNERNLGNQSVKGAAGPASRYEGLDYDVALNSMAEELQVLDLLSYEAGHGRRGTETASAEGVSVTYTLQTRSSLPSRSDRQIVQIAALPMKAEFYKLATPLITEFVYDEAQVTNTSSLFLLPGPVSTYVDGEFVGRGDIPAVAAGQSFEVGLGIDPTLRAARELVNRNEMMQGGNRVVTIRHRLTIENFGAADVDVRLLDRIPTIRNAQVKITLSDKYETPTESKDGVLRWDVTAPAAGEEPGKVERQYEFTLEYDKQMTLVGVDQ